MEVQEAAGHSVEADLAGTGLAGLAGIALLVVEHLPVVELQGLVAEHDILLLGGLLVVVHMREELHMQEALLPLVEERK